MISRPLKNHAKLELQGNNIFKWSLPTLTFNKHGLTNCGQGAPSSQCLSISVYKYRYLIVTLGLFYYLNHKVYIYKQLGKH